MITTSGPLAIAIVEACKARGLDVGIGPLTEERLVEMVVALRAAAKAEGKLRAAIEELTEDGEGYASADQLRRALAGWGPRPPRKKKPPTSA